LSKESFNFFAWHTVLWLLGIVVTGGGLHSPSAFQFSIEHITAL